jgi:microcystin-dependent protein
MEFYIGQIIMMANYFIPKNFLPCDGRVIPIMNNQTLFSLIGTKYGGDGRTNFALPNLMHRLPVEGFSGRVMVSGHGGDTSIPTTDIKYCICISGLYPEMP